MTDLQNIEAEVEEILDQHHKMLKVFLIAQPQGMTHEGSEKFIIDETAHQLAQLCSSRELAGRLGELSDWVKKGSTITLRDYAGNQREDIEVIPTHALKDRIAALKKKEK